MRDVVDVLDAARGRGDRAAVATVVDVRRSAPRPPGAKMLIDEHGGYAGMVSGGCVEGAVVQAAQEVLEGAPPRLLRFGIADEDAWDVGLPCGGEIDVWVSEAPPESFAEAARTGGRAALVTLLEGEGAGAQMVVTPDGAREGTLGSPERDAAGVAAAEELLWAERSERRGELFVDVTFPPPRLIVVGAVDIAARLCTLARECGFRPYVCDPRGFFATAARFPDAEEVVAAWPEEAFARLGGIDRATSVAILTHDPKVDDAALRVALRSEAAYVGAMGSRRMQERRRERLLAGGMGEEELDRLAAPIGLDLGALTPEETALSILAEIVAARRGREGGPLREATGRIHEVGG